MQGYDYLFLLEDDIIRIAVLPNGTWEMPSTWSIAAGASDVANAGRAREDLSGFSMELAGSM